jgi:cytosine/adenosine deaminase-related metal-dependent hydrolase
VGCSSTSDHAPTRDAGADVRSVDAADGGGAPPLCTVTPGSAGTLLRGTLLLPGGPSLGELLISSQGTIACAALSCASTAGYKGAAVVDCPGGVISPGLINSHDHTDYATMSPEAHGTIRYDHRNDWRVGAEGAKALPTVEQATSSQSVLVAAQELRMIVGGATSILGSGGVVGLARNLAESGTPAQVTEGLTGNTIYFDTFPLGDEDGKLLSSGCGYPSIEPAFGAFEYGRYAPHIAEGINLAAENEVTCTDVASNDLITSKTSVIHGVGMNALDVAKLEKAGAYLIWAPRSNISLYGNTAPVTELRYAGVPIALGTDWLPSGSMNMLRELACADAVNRKYFAGTFSDADLFAMATLNGATAAGFEDQIGSLTVGKQADVAVFDGRVNLGYRAVIAASSEDVRLVLRGGKVLYGDAPVVEALATSCTPWTVCGAARAVCLDTPGITLGDFEGAGTSLYEIASCRTATPPGEPTCVPYRDTYADGTSATDRDGDGVPDGADDCPDIFNPVRPMDGTSQSDVDGDGFGDACDAFPLDKTKH